MRPQTESRGGGTDRKTGPAGSVTHSSLCGKVARERANMKQGPVASSGFPELGAGRGCDPRSRQGGAAGLLRGCCAGALQKAAPSLSGRLEGPRGPAGPGGASVLPGTRLPVEAARL